MSTGVTRPVDETVATLSSLDDQRTSLNSALPPTVAVSCYELSDAASESFVALSVIPVATLSLIVT